MARQEDECWRCGTPWATEVEQPATITRLPAPPHVAGDLANGDAGLDVDRWANAGGTGPDQDRAVIVQRAGSRR
jgi:hypothetical protein